MAIPEINDIIKFEDTKYIKTVEIQKNDEIESRKKILDDLEKKIIELEIKSNNEFAISTDLNKQIKDTIKNIENYRKELVKPMNDKVTKINASFKKISERALKMKITLESKIIEYNKKLRAEAEKIADIQRKKEVDELEKKKKIAKMQASFLEDNEKVDPSNISLNAASNAAESFDKAIEEKKEKPISFKSSFNTGKTQTNIRQTWIYEIIDRVKIPIEFCIPDSRKIMTAINIGTRDIPGLKIYQKDIVSSRGVK